MVFTSDILRGIVEMGARGWSPTRISSELNMTYDEVLDLCKKNEKFKNAIDRALMNYERFLIDEIMDGSTAKNARVQSHVFKKLIDKHGGNSDNKIEIEYV